MYTHRYGDNTHTHTHMENTHMEKTIGNYKVSISSKGQVKVSDHRFVNHGLIYSHNIPTFKRGTINPVTGHRFQVLGMDSELTKAVKEWIYKQIEQGNLDHLIESHKTAVKCKPECMGCVCLDKTFCNSSCKHYPPSN